MVGKTLGGSDGRPSVAFTFLLLERSEVAVPSHGKAGHSLRGD